MAFDINNFVIDRVIRGIMTSTDDGSVMWSINQITDPSLSVTMETSEAVDAIGSRIATFNRGKAAEFSAQNSLFDLGLWAAQNGTEKEVASAENKIVAPIFETIEVPTNVTTPVTLKHTPTEIPKEIYQLKGDGTLGEKLIYGATAAAGKFTYDESTHAITFPAASTAGTQYFVQYEYESESAVAVTGNAVDFPKAGKFIMELLGTDVCNTTVLVHAYLVFPNAKLDGNVDVTFATDGNHPFTIQANQSYCDNQKVLFQLVIPDEE